MSYKFTGYDYEELAECWGLELPDDDEDTFLEHDLRVKAISDYIWSHFDHGEECLSSNVKGDMVNYLFALKNNQHESAYLVMWEALLELSEKDDFVFTQMFCVLLPWMWD